MFLAIQRFPPTRFRRPINRRAGSVINSGINRRRFNVKQTNTNVKPMPNLAKFPGMHNSCILLKLRYKNKNVRCNIMLASNNFIFFQAHLTPARLQELPIYQ